MSADLRSELENFLQSLNIETSCVEHPPVLTVEQMMPHLQHIDGVATKNLFLKEKKKNNLWLVCVRHDREINLNQLGNKLGVKSGNLRFTDEKTLLQTLKVQQGCVSVLSLLFDHAHHVQLLLDRDLLEGNHHMIFSHPMSNSASLGLKPADLLRFLEATNHSAALESFD
ncbi:prolyl-tRNA synthetase associated domain-containing protein 1 [Gouania willdenowi]|uniref:PrdX deacylase domain-containing protein 1 n=1 Tax=Gouania willdenowi TaxID=441366 RepID=A0A8C5H7X7_GOUWI|nr:prolyl-tRNA synthetase associated domain-containing protein 1-like [Gouania willdenowi]